MDRERLPPFKEQRAVVGSVIKMRVEMPRTKKAAVFVWDETQGKDRKEV